MTEQAPGTRAAEAWLRGPIDGIVPLLQPVAHALVQTRDEARILVRELPDDRLWDRPAGAASAGFHLQHLAGVLDRLFTYARGESLSPHQRTALENEGRPVRPGITALDLFGAFDQQVDIALEQLRRTPAGILTQPRPVGRKRMPSTVHGLLFHAAEHAQRHLGQLIVTSRMVREGSESRRRAAGDDLDQPR